MDEGWDMWYSHKNPYPWLLADSGAYDILGNPTGELFWASAIKSEAKRRELYEFGRSLK